MKIFLKIKCENTKNPIKNPTSLNEKWGPLVQSMTPSIKGYFEEDDLLPNMSMGQEGMKVKGYGTKAAFQDRQGIKPEVGNLTIF